VDECKPLIMCQAQPRPTAYIWLRLFAASLLIAFVASLYRRRLNLKAKFESGSPHFTFKR